MLAGTRDIAIIILAVESIVIGVLLAVLLIQIRRLIRMLREEVKPMLDSANDTVQNVKGTTQFVSHTVVDPLVEIKSYWTGTRHALQSLFAMGRDVREERVAADIEIDDVLEEVPDASGAEEHDSTIADGKEVL